MGCPAMQELAIEELKGNADKIQHEFGAEVVMCVFTPSGAIVHGTTHESIHRAMSINFTPDDAEDGQEGQEDGEGQEGSEACAPCHKLTSQST